ncbi:tenascin-X isoform X13 [Pleurodeles waltl]|uniref:tenascin-X isoform X13 n=1 Tax=Pleurodeles waltl TaxID=8319 RepID=UPI003709B4BE
MVSPAVAVVLVLAALQLGPASAGLFTKRFRLRRAAGANATFFSHVYNIRMPRCESCAADVAAPTATLQEARGETTQQQLYEHTMEGDQQMVFTHRINIPPQACGCSNADTMQRLLRRLEALEAQVAAFRDQCPGGTCCAATQAGHGQTDIQGLCSQHGKFDFDKCRCVCERGWGGPTCSESSCPDSCNDRGTCMDSECICHEGFTGESCELTICLDDCNDQGRCIGGKCVCFPGYTGPACGDQSCPDNCRGHGKCIKDSCVCDPGYTGPDCSTKVCPDNCRDRGKCLNGSCVCESGFGGPDCGTKTCPENCRNRGKCIDGICVCSPGYTGPDCGSRSCPENCKNRGQCINGKCICNPGFTGPACGARSCPENCHGHGQCINGKCLCNPGYSGSSCSSRICPDNCSRRGICKDGRCICSKGFTGPNCGIRTCPENCQNGGRCENGLCVCEAGYAGPNCATKTCPDNCKNRGRCEDGRCVCDEGYAGSNCGTKTCPDNCRNQGRCEDGTCVCETGFTGPNCGTKTCPDDCRKQGRCEDGTCVCETGFTGPNCGTKTCPDDCRNQGRCEDGTCVCETGFTGPNCGTKTCPDNCNNRGQCKDGRCACDKGFAGSNCGTKTCPDDCTNQGRCEDGTCVCETGFTGPNCGTKTCPDNCRNHGRCEDGTCVCETGFTGPNCGTKTCPDNCKNQGRCDDGTCVCETGFTGPNCGTKTCPDNCSSHGLCVDGQCVCKAGYGGPDCGTRTCPNNCNNRGRCENGKCICDKGYGGPICGLKLCPNNCNNQGRCLKGTCICRRGYTGPDCREVTCPSQCQGRGICVDGHCQCQTGYAGPDCGEKTCPSDCSEKGRCEGGKCVCQDGFTGEDCSIEVPAVSGLRMRIRDETSVIMEWERPPIPVDGFEISFRPTNKDDGVLSSRLRSTVTAFNQSGLVPGEEYLVTIWTQKDQTLGPETTKTVTTRIDGPKNLRVTEVTQASITLHWDRPVASVDHYLVTYASEAGVTRQVTVPAAGKEVVTLLELDSGAEYTLTVTAERGRESSMPASTTATTAPEPSSMSTASDESPVGAPSTQASHSDSMAGQLPASAEPYFISFGELSVTNITYHSFALSWNADPGAYDHFAIRYKDSAATGPVEVLFSGDQRTATLSPLLPGTEYEIELQGVVDGLRTIPLTTKATTDYRKPKEQPSLLGGLAITSIAEDGFSLTWKARKGVFDVFLVRYEDARGQFGSQEITVPGDHRVTTIRGLDSATEYIVSLYGVRRGQLSRALKTKVTTASAEGDGMPARVEDLSATDIQEDSIRLSWTVHDGDFDFFLIQYRDADGQTQEMTIRGDQTSANIPGLLHTRNYTFVLYGISDDEKTKPISVTAMTAPLTPRLGDLSVLDVTQDSLRLSWSVQDGEFDSFLLQYRDSQGRTEQMHVDAGLHKVTVSGLQPAETYMFELVGLSTDKQSEPVSVVAKTALPEKTATQLFNLSATDVTQDSLHLYWNASAEDFDSFLIQYRDAEGKPQELIVDGDLRSATISGLRPSKKYKFSLYGVSGDRREKSISTEVTTAAAGKAQITPRLGKLNISDIMQDSLRLSWTVQGGDFDSFLILYRDAQGNIIELPVPGDLQIVTISGLKPSKKYKFLLHGISASKRSKPVSAEATTAAAGKVLISPRLGKLNISDITQDSLRLSWTVQGGDFDSFLILYRDPQGNALELPVPGDLRIETISGLKPSKKYKFLLHGISTSKRSKPVSAEATTAAAGKALISPRLGKLNISDITQDSLRLSWTVQGGDFDSFLILYRDAQGNTLELPVPGDLRIATISGLKPSKKYKFLLHGISSSKRSKPVSAVATTAAAGKVLISPRLGKLNISDITQDSLRLSWTLQGGDFDSFLILYRDAQGNTLELPVPGDLRTATISGLKPSKKYKFLLHGISTSKRSKPVSAEATTAVQKKKVAMMGDISITEVQKDSLVLSWAVSGGDFDSFVIQYKDSEGIPRQTEVDGHLRTTTIKGLKPSGKYKFVLYGVSENRRAPPVSAEAITAAFEDPPTPSPWLGELTVSDVTKDSVLLSWTHQGGDYDTFLILYRDADGRPRGLPVQKEQRTAHVSGLMPATKYTFLLYGVKGRSRSTPITAEATTGPDKVQAPKPMLADLSISEVTEDSLQLSWAVQGGDFDTFLIQYRDPEETPQELEVDGKQHTATISGLVPSEKYTFYLQGIIGTQRIGPISTEAVTASLEKPKARPARLGDLSISNITQGSLQLSWTIQDGDFDSFLIQYRDIEGKVQELPVDRELHTVTVSGLRPSKKYKFILYGLTGDRRSKSISTEATTVPLEKVTTRLPRLSDLSVSDITKDSLQLSWAVEDGSFGSFLIQYRDADGTPTVLIVDGDFRTARIVGLKPAKKYKFNIYGVSGERRTKALATEATTAPPEKANTHPPRLGEFFVSDITKDSLQLTWTVEDGDFDSFVIQYRDTDGQTQELVVEGDLHTTTVTGLLPSRKYEFNLYGISRNRRTKPISTEATTAFPEAVGQQAAMLDDLYLSDMGPHTVHLSWDASEGAFDSFLIQYADSKGVSPKGEMVMAGNARTAMIEGLEPNTEYTFTLSGLHRGQKRANLSTVGRTTRLDLESPRNLEFRNIKETSFMVIWTRPTMPIDTFKVSYQLADGGEPQSLSVDGKATKVPLKGLTPGARYEVNVMSIRGFEESEPLTGYVTTVPDGPTDLRAINITETSALLLWRPALAYVDTYVVTFSAHNVPEVTKLLSGNTAELQLRGLNINTEYTATIHSTKGSNRSSPAITTFTTSADAPRDLVASRVTPRSAVLSWTPAQAVPTGYVLTYETASGETKEIQLEASATSYTLSELIPSSQYRARVQAMRDKVKTAPTSTTFTTARLRYPFPRDCAEERLNGAIRSQPVTIYLKGDRSHPLRVFCDMDTDGGGWMVVQRRMNGKTNFWRNWYDYAAGFGNLTQEFWLGNENLHKLTSQGAYELRVDLRTKNESAYAVYESFRVDTQDNYYRLRLGKYSGTAGDSLSYHNNMIFSTRDRDRNKHIMPCSISYRGAWWYKNCHYANLNGLYGNNKDHQGINWYTWKGFEFSIPFTEMKMRPKNSVALRRI